MTLTCDDCGYIPRSTDPSRQARGLKLHSCDRQRAINNARTAEQLAEAERIARELTAINHGQYVISYTREHGLRLHFDLAVADDWIAAAPMADEDLAPVFHLPVGLTG